MSSSTKIILLAALLVLIAAAIAANFIPVREESLHYTEHTTNAGELVAGTLVGQTFVARADNLSGIGVKFATYSNRSNTKPVELHVREGLASSADARVATVNAADLGDNQLHRFEFDPIENSAKKTFFFFVVSPESRPGDAVTVDLDARDPYHEGSAYLVREAPGTPLTPEVVARSGKQAVDVVFSTYHSTSLRAASINAGQRLGRSILATWGERQDQYLLWLELLAPVLAFCLLIAALRGDGETEPALPPKMVGSLLALIIVGAVLFRLLYATSMPLTNDEGNYLYDARTLLQGTLAGGDGYVKAPLVIAWLALWQFLGGNTILAGRLAMIFASALSAIPLYYLGRLAGSQRTGLLAAAAWALMGAPAVFGVYVHTQSVALLLGVTGIALLWVALKQPDPSIKWFIGAGVLLGLGVASRKSILALGLVPLMLILVLSRTWRERIRRLAIVGVAFGFIIAAFAIAAAAIYGCDDPLILIRDGGRCMGVEEALGANSAEDGLTAVTLEEAENVRAYSLRGMTPFFRESLSLILLSLVGWGIVLETTVRRTLARWQAVPRSKRLLMIVDQGLPKVAWLLPGAVLWWAWSFFTEYEGSVFHELGGMDWAWVLGAACMAVIAAWPRPVSQKLRAPDSDEIVIPTSTQPSNVVGQGWKSASAQVRADAADHLDIELPLLTAVSLLPLAWVGGLVVFYMNWIKFHANYIGEFLPPLALMSGLGAYWGWQRIRGRTAFEVGHPGWAAAQRLLAGVFMVAVVWSAYLGNYVTYVFEHTGTFDQGAVQEAAVWAQANIPLDQPIFTGAAVVPYLSGHRTALDIAHPRWYAYEFTRKDTARLNTFLPSAEAMLAAYREADWFLLEQQTGFSFLMEYTEIEAGLATDWQVVHEVENLSNPLKFYRRVR